MSNLLTQAVSVGELRPFDIQFAEYITAANGDGEIAELSLAAALASYRLSLGDTSFAIDNAAHFGLFSHPDIDASLREVPTPGSWREVLLAQSVVQEVAEDIVDLTDHEVEAPLILDKHNRLYLSRYWQFEQSLLSILQSWVDAPSPEVDAALLTQQLKLVFNNSTETDWQKVAAAVAAIKKFCVITGGPGTGKTYTVAAVLSVLHSLNGNQADMKVALAAPTGKAAARLTESLQSSQVLPDAYRCLEAVTLHRLMGLIPGKTTSRFHAENPLPHDVVIIDEASMIDLPLMVRTLSAVSEDSRLILLGDKDQLASVESGMVLADICGMQTRTQLSSRITDELRAKADIDVAPAANPKSPVADHIIYLNKSHRADDQSGIAGLSEAINSGDVDASLEYFSSDQYPALQTLDHRMQNIDQMLLEHVLPCYQSLVSVSEPESALEKMKEVCVLCALKRGRSGADGINQRARAMLQEQQIITADSANYHGKPVLVTENNAAQKLFNGDYGISWQCGKDLKVYFPGESGVRAIAPSRLPRHETFYAMTVHKSQGSEYDSVIVILPDSDSPLLTRELLYTAVTRARKKVTVIANTEQLAQAITVRSQRQSGILGVLWPGAERAPESAAESGAVEPAFSGTPTQTELDFSR